MGLLGVSALAAVRTVAGGEADDVAFWVATSKGSLHYARPGRAAWHRSPKLSAPLEQGAPPSRALRRLAMHGTRPRDLIGRS